jgi:hypothetical protein
MAEMGTGHGYGGFVNDGLIDEMRCCGDVGVAAAW